MIWAMLWCLQGRLPPHAFVTIYYDCCFVGECASGKGGWDDPSVLPVVLRSLGQLLEVRLCSFRSRGSALWQHVKGHSGHPWNECVDAIAKTARSKGLVRMQVSTALSALVRDKSRLTLQWLWLVAGKEERIDLPVVTKEGGLRVTHHETSTDFKETKLVPFLADGSRESETRSPCSIQMKTGSANVLTLGGSCEIDGGGKERRVVARVELLQEQFMGMGYVFIGLQETRANRSGTRRTGSFLAIASAATKGKGGCEFWVNPATPFGSTDKGEYCFDE